ncbi:phospholipid carrier-dependent glycosyltransferase [Patescibacteria group bacterium]|nr:phospholipid carrier-dependent glycosyltransferase [Patescibacteria group bacterium]
MTFRTKLINILKQVGWIWFLCVFFVLYRLPILGFDIINIDAPVWKTRTFQFSSALFKMNFADTAVTYHPGVTLMWLSAIGVKFYNLFARFFYQSLDYSTIRDYTGSHFTQKLMIILCLSFFLFFILYIISKLYSKSYALLFYCVFLFEPYVLGLTRVLHTDGLVTFFSFSAILSLYYFSLNTRRKFWFFLSAFSCSLALLTKSNSLILLGFLGLCILVYFFYKEKNLATKFSFSVKYGFLYLFLVLFFFSLFWPAMWVSPIATLKLYYDGIVNIGLEPHSQIWMGSEIDSPGLNYYPIVLFIRLTPWFLFFSLSGIILFLYGLSKKTVINHYKLFLVALAFILIYSLVLSFSDKKLGRYILTVTPFLALFCSYFISELIVISKKFVKFKSKYYFLFFSLIFFLFSFFSTFKIFPNYLMYYSPLIGGYTSGSIIEDPKWPIGYGDLARFLNALPNSDERYILIRYGYLYNPFNLSHNTGTLSQKTEKDAGSYFVLEKYTDFRYLKGKGVSLKYIYKVGGIDMFYIYEILGEYPVTQNYKFIIPSGIKADPKWN